MENIHIDVIDNDLKRYEFHNTGVTPYIYYNDTLRIVAYIGGSTRDKCLISLYSVDYNWKKEHLITINNSKQLEKFIYTYKRELKINSIIEN